MTSDPAPRPGGRSARVRAAVLAATADLLVEGQGEAPSADAVAVRADVHRSTVHRRWPTPLSLLDDLARERSGRVVSVPDTGALATDLRALARAVADLLGTEPDASLSRALVRASGRPGAASGAHAFWADRLAATTVVVERAVARGEVPTGVDATLAIEALIGPLWVRSLLTGGPIDHAVADAVADLVASGLAHGFPSPRTEP